MRLTEGQSIHSLEDDVTEIRSILPIEESNSFETPQTKASDNREEDGREQSDQVWKVESSLGPGLRIRRSTGKVKRGVLSRFFGRFN